jgi:Phosphotransferase enzyme family
MSEIDCIYHEGIKELLSKIGIHAEYHLIPLEGGRNNRAFKLICGIREYFLKAYFFSSADPRDRLLHEFGFTNFVWSNGIRIVPEPLAELPNHHLALYEFIAGKTANYRPTTISDIHQATDFILSVNHHRANNAAEKLPQASEACFSMSDHIRNTAARVNRLLQIEVADDYDNTAKQQVDQRLLPLWDDVVNNINAQIKKKLFIDKTLSADQRWISPSDFGFHNAIEEGGGRLRFVDFEYAGWDDPAKMLCDFANQPDRILESSLSNKFIQDIITADVNPEFLRYRYALLEPLYQIKWACIILNDFLPMGGARRSFTHSTNMVENKKAQLEKLNAMLHRVNGTIKSNAHYLN